MMMWARIVKHRPGRHASPYSAWLVLVSAAGGLLVLCAAAGASAQAPRSLDDFTDLTPWAATASDGVKARVGPSADPARAALRLDFDFGDVSGWASARRALPLDLPDNYELSFWLHGDAPANTLEVKLADASGQNVWWRRFPDMAFPTDRRQITISKRQIEFAWGPTADKTLRHAATLEFVVSRGVGGGKGSIWIDHLAFRPLPTPPAVPPPLTASSPSPASSPALAVDGDLATAWKAASGEASITLDLGLVREFGGLTLDWTPGHAASGYTVSLSDDRQAWRAVREVVGARGARQSLRLPDSAARYVRLDLHDAPGPGYALAEARIEPLAYGATRTAFVEALAKEAPRGAYPRAFRGEQSYWTLVGVDGGSASGLMSEDGAIEVGKGGFSIEPFVIDRGRMIAWSDVAVIQTLKDGYLPMPGVVWRRPEWEMRITSFAYGDAKTPQLAARYELANLTARPRTLELVLAARPLQVNGPEQFLNTPGGFSPIDDLAWAGGRLVVNGRPRVYPLTAPDRFAAAAFDAAVLPGGLMSGGGAPGPVHDQDGMASGALTYRLTLPPHGRATVDWVAPLTDAPLAATPSAAALDLQEAEVAQAWRARLGQVSFTAPPQARAIVDTLRTSLAHMLMSRRGPMLRPGTRSYDRAWIRDGAMISEALMRMGDADVASDFLRWYAPRQFTDGKVPCCVDARGADPTPENDSDGELIFLAAQVYRYTADKALLRSLWPRIQAAADHLDVLRQAERTAANQTPGRLMLYGLLPPSISHEGYSSKPAYSYWDDFWALRGYEDAVFIAEALGESDATARLSRSRDTFRGDLYASLTASTVAHGIDYIPGAADLGDFDPTSTTIALAPGGEADRLPKALLDNTFERYWRRFVDRRDRDRTWEAYTPYELRTVGAFVRLGRRDRAAAALDFFMRDRRPPAWNGWAEVVGREARKPRFIGDMPHAWVASDYVRSVLDMFAYDRDSDHALVLAAGIPPGWFAGRGVGVRDLRTPYGKLTWSARLRNHRLTLRVSGAAHPPGGFIFPWPFPGDPGVTRVNGRAAYWRGGVLRLDGAGGAAVIEQRPR